MDTCIAALRGTKKVDLFETARVAQNVSVEEAMKTLVELKNEGKFDHIGMSECGAESLRRAHAVHPVAAVEIEVSLWSYEEETKKGWTRIVTQTVFLSLTYATDSHSSCEGARHRSYRVLVRDAVWSSI